MSAFWPTSPSSRADRRRARAGHGRGARASSGGCVIVTTSHFASRVCAERSRRRRRWGRPGHGHAALSRATIRAAEPAIFAFFRAVSDSPAFRSSCRMHRSAARTSGRVGPHGARDRRRGLLKIECRWLRPSCASWRAGRGGHRGAMGREEAITLMADLDAVPPARCARRLPGRHPPGRVPFLTGGATRRWPRTSSGSRSSTREPALRAGRPGAHAGGGVIASDGSAAARAAAPAARAGLLDRARSRDPLVLRWAGEPPDRFDWRRR